MEAFIWMFVVLKIPIVALLWLVWWAVKEPEPPVEVEEDEGGSKRPHGPQPSRPPRRGPGHGDSPPAPARVRFRAGGRLLRHR
jgi:hypothetical protein